MTPVPATIGDVSQAAATDERPALKGRALAAWRKARAVELAIPGRRYDDIAREVGYSNRGTAHWAVSQALRERTTEAVEELRTALELLRLDELQDAPVGQGIGRRPPGRGGHRADHSRPGPPARTPGPIDHVE
jgi:hypothetical protein